MNDHSNAIASLEGIAAHLERNPSLPKPIDIRVRSYDSPQIQVTAVDFQEWRNTATHLGIEEIVDGTNGYHAVSAVVFGSTAVRLVCVEDQGMTRQTFALLVGFGYQTATVVDTLQPHYAGLQAALGRGTVQ